MQWLITHGAQHPPSVLLRHLRATCTMLTGQIQTDTSFAGCSQILSNVFSGGTIYGS